eukprot:CAMPEP_0179159036 /NCGR_PEP_ID=MMETSP0796-20121207/77633_1 /TAXON_ID=73915 /ORGANISM="Pyrodinium bahamense, Strain pbaha01" /LENGTH=140 /DNA_ID=CAMNT_0020860755 /DNA_START=37 /DNA_END=457 /DNA_ORIENTATION=+
MCLSASGLPVGAPLPNPCTASGGDCGGPGGIMPNTQRSSNEAMVIRDAHRVRHEGHQEAQVLACEATALVSERHAEERGECRGVELGVKAWALADCRGLEGLRTPAKGGIWKGRDCADCGRSASLTSMATHTSCPSPSAG